MTTKLPLLPAPADGRTHYFGCDAYLGEPCSCGGYVEDAKISRLYAAMTNVGVNVDAPDRGRSDGPQSAGTGRTYDLTTDKQLAFLARLGVTVEGTLSKVKASSLIDAALKAAPATPATAPAAPVRSNRYAANCDRCGGNVPAETGALDRDASGKWIVTHLGECPARVAPAPEDGYEAQRGDIHVLDGEFYRVHIGQTSGYPYLVKAIVISGATWGTDEDGNKELIEAGVIEWEHVRGGLRKLSEATKATAEQAAAFGALVGRCCFCSTPIDTPESTAVGYGPKCAENYGLPWGSRKQMIG